MQFPDSKTLIAVLWGVGLSMGVLFLFIIPRSYDSFELSKDTYLNVRKKNEILSQMRINFHKSVEMEKNAVMALTDEESQDYAGQSLAFSAAVEEDLTQIQSLIDATSCKMRRNLSVSSKPAGWSFADSIKSFWR